VTKKINFGRNLLNFYFLANEKWHFWRQNFFKPISDGEIWDLWQSFFVKFALFDE